jgi:hypothetical protein
VQVINHASAREPSLSAYPRFFFDGSGDGELAFGITNDADHVVMRPLFTDLGYSLDRFTGESNLSDFEQQIIAEIEALPNLREPEGYTKAGLLT